MQVYPIYSKSHYSSSTSLTFHFQSHCVNAEGLQRLLLLMEGSKDMMNKAAGAKDKSGPDPGTSLLGSALVSERHAYKYRCNQCSLAFKTQEKLALHSQYHVIRDATRCRLCSRSFRSIQALIRHVDSGHGDDVDGIDREELAHYKLGLMNHPLLIAGLSGQSVLDPSTNELLKKESAAEEDGADEVEQNSSSEQQQEQSFNDISKKVERFLGGGSGSGGGSSYSGIVRKTDKGLTYPLEKFLDPNRPYKCDVCKESFTQKNILLVHYNSVSHLHKLKRTMQDQQREQQQQKQQQQHQQQQRQGGTPPQSDRGSLETAISNLRKDEGDESSKPYKCNICKVSYSQGSTLDIHIRSVLHQTRASKLQELAMSGQIDLSRPLIEQPDPKQSQTDQQKKTLTEMLSPKSLNSSGSSNLHTSPPTLSHQVPSSPGGPPTPLSSPLAASLQQVLGGLNQQPNQPGSGVKSLNELFASQEQMQQQQQLAKLLQALPNFPSGLGTGSSSPISPSPLSPSNNGDKTPPMASMFNLPESSKKSSHVLKGLLQNYGFELVMQFNEYHQRKRQREEEERRQREKEEEQKSAAEEAVAAGGGGGEKRKHDEGGVNGMATPSGDSNTESNGASDRMPEIKRSKCPICSKEFSSIWVLKAHSEEIHKDVVPPEFLNKYVEELKSNLEKKTESGGNGGEGSTTEERSSPSGATPAKSPRLDAARTLELTRSDEKSSSRGPRDTSTPKSGKNTPMHQSMNPEQDKSPRESPAARPPSQKASTSRESPNNISNMQNAFQQAILAAQQQSQSINPMMMHMSQFQGMNPLVAMNLQPPLIPPALLQQANGQPHKRQQPLAAGSAKASSDPMVNAFLSQMQAASKQQQQTQVDPQMQLLAMLGIDPKTLAQSGLDPKLLMQQFGQSPDPKQMFQPGGLDSNLLGLLKPPPPPLQGSPQGMPDPKTLFQMQQMGLLPNPPDPKVLMQLAKMGGGSQGIPVSTADMFDPTKNPFMPGFDMSKQSSDPNSKSFAAQKQPPPMFHQPEQAKRARTRITDDQLKILRSNFDITNSPTEEITNLMAQQTGLPPKVIKHWFRNTLFKERQRNKDSPYNFNNPPSTMLNLEEYEKTGEPKVTMLTPIDQKELCAATNDESGEKKEKESSSSKSEVCHTPTPDEQIIEDNVAMVEEEKPPVTECTNHPASTSETVMSNTGGVLSPSTSPVIMQHCSSSTSNSPTLLQVSKPSDSLHLSHNLSNMLSGQLSPLSKPGNFLPHGLVPNFSPGGAMSPLPGPLPNLFNPLANMMSNDQQPRSRSPSQSCSQGKRANRTRFTDYQIKVLQEFFENNAYPKDDDLEYLSKLLTLSPRVIVVWFQNARQKARKIYENQPPLDPNDDGAGRFTRTPGLNYQCKKCLLVFQRYYELIRHQKQHCFKEEDAKRSAKAQQAAAQAAAQFSNLQTTSSMNPMTPHSEDSNSSLPAHDKSRSSPMHFNSSGQENRHSFDSSDEQPNFDLMFQGMRREEEKKLTPSMFDQLTREAEHFPKFGNATGSTLFPSYPPTTPFGMLQQQASLQGSSKDRDSADELDNDSIDSSPSSSKRKHSDDGEMEEKDGEGAQHRDKRLRTTILPEQLDYLYQKYQIESNPSRKMLEQIASEVGLRKRVVQVWFQNTRARERKGQFRAHQQVINKRCPFCPALFKVRSALESHLATKHADQYTKGEINIDALPEAEGFDVDNLGMPSQLPPLAPIPPASLTAGVGVSNVPPFMSTGEDIGMQSMRKYYEDTMKRYLNDLQGRSASPPPPPPDMSIMASSGSRREGGQALDLTSPLPLPPKPNAPVPGSAPPALDLSRPIPTEHENDVSAGFMDKTETMSENNLESRIGDFEMEDSPSSPISAADGHGGPSSSTSSPSMNKRFRTQMSTMQIKVMKSVFEVYKTPTMTECSSLGQDISLQKRVVQVWFQNARAKEKKARLQLQQLSGVPEADMMPQPPEECKVCNHTYTHKHVIQDHIFSKAHLDAVRSAVEEGKIDPETPGQALSQAVAALEQQIQQQQPPPPQPLPQASNSEVKSDQEPSSISVAADQAVAAATLSGTSGGVRGGGSGEVEKTLMQQIYGMNHGIASYPSGVATANPFLHPAMFSATGKSDYKKIKCPLGERVDRFN
jgi:uncharacterized C2H2 Zn-finger protein